MSKATFRSRRPELFLQKDIPGRRSKLTGENPCDPNSDWIKGFLFAHRVSKHTSIKFSPFFLMYNREPTLPVNIKYNLVDIEENGSEHPFKK